MKPKKQAKKTVFFFKKQASFFLFTSLGILPYRRTSLKLVEIKLGYAITLTMVKTGSLILRDLGTKFIFFLFSFVIFLVNECNELKIGNKNKVLLFLPFVRDAVKTNLNEAA